MKNKKKRHKRLSMKEKVIRAARLAAKSAIEEHKRYGVPLVVWKNGKTVLIPPEKLP
jgi:NCAIR mutase (PurE)-related protein